MGAAGGFAGDGVREPLQPRQPVAPTGGLADFTSGTQPRNGQYAGPNAAPRMGAFGAAPAAQGYQGAKLINLKCKKTVKNAKQSRQQNGLRPSSKLRNTMDLSANFCKLKTATSAVQFELAATSSQSGISHLVCVLASRLCLLYF